MTHKSKDITENIKYQWINQLNKNSKIVRMNIKEDAKILYMRYILDSRIQIFLEKIGEIYAMQL